MKQYVFCRSQRAEIQAAVMYANFGAVAHVVKDVGEQLREWRQEENRTERAKHERVTGAWL